MNILIDTNIILDVLLERQPWFDQAREIWQACDEQRITGYIVASTVTDIFYVARKTVGLEQALNAVKICLATFVICPVDHTILTHALTLAGKDFEDNIQISVALFNGLHAIVTRNTKDFDHVGMDIYTPTELLSKLGNDH